MATKWPSFDTMAYYCLQLIIDNEQDFIFLESTTCYQDDIRELLDVILMLPMT